VSCETAHALLSSSTRVRTVLSSSPCGCNAQGAASSRAQRAGQLLLLKCHSSLWWLITVPDSRACASRQVMCLWPFRSMIMRGGADAAARASAAGAGAAVVAPEPLFHFGDATALRQALQMTNRLTGCNLGSRAEGPIRPSGLGHETLSVWCMACMLPALDPPM
jgi:hypothetical protein